MNNKLIFLLAVLASLSQACQTSQSSDIYHITNFGAVGDSTTLNTKAIQSAIDAAAEAGGGRVIVPPGKYLIGGIELKDNIIFELQGGATLLGTCRLWIDYLH